jgi:DNA-binding phage protein
MKPNTIPGVGLPADGAAEDVAMSPVPALTAPRLENAAAFADSKLRLYHLQDPADAARLLRAAIERSEAGIGTLANRSKLTRAAVYASKKARYHIKLDTFLRIIDACGARIYVGIPRKK